MGAGLPTGEPAAHESDAVVVPVAVAVNEVGTPGATYV